METRYFPSIATARQNSDLKIERLRNELAPVLKDHPDVDVLAFGSLARKDYTSGSDVDWGVVVDGRVTQDIRRLPKAVGEKLEKIGIPAPSDASEFGKLSSSLEIIGSIASRHDARLSLSRRMLLLFESVSLTSGRVRDRMIAEVLNSYQSEETLSNESKFAVPRYLLNDTDLFWRLMCTDYSGQTRARTGKHWGLRSIKLNFSRKLLAFSGLLRCLECHLHLEESEVEVKPREQLGLIYNRLRETLQYTPGQTVENLLPPKVSEPIKTCYEDFLRSIDDPNVRQTLSDLTWEDSEDCQDLQGLWSLARGFHDRLADVLLEEPYARLTRGCLLP